MKSQRCNQLFFCKNHHLRYLTGFRIGLGKLPILLLFINNLICLMNLKETITLYNKWSFPLRIYSVNVTISVGNCGFGHSSWRNPKCKTAFGISNFPKNYTHSYSPKERLQLSSFPIISRRWFWKQFVNQGEYSALTNACCFCRVYNMTLGTYALKWAICIFAFLWTHARIIFTFVSICRNGRGNLKSVYI